MKLRSFLALTTNCDKNLIVLKHTDFPTQNGLIYTDFFLNILRTQNTALGTWRGCKYCSGSYFLFKSNSDFINLESKPFFTPGSLVDGYVPERRISLQIPNKAS